MYLPQILDRIYENGTFIGGDSYNVPFRAEDIFTGKVRYSLLYKLE